MWEYFFQPSGPKPKFILRVSAKLIGSGTWSVFRREDLVVETVVYRREEISPEKASYTLEVFDVPLFREE
jgi:hypothetical protein